MRGVKTSVGSEREQRKYLALGAAIGFIGGATNWPMWYGIKFPPYPNILISVYILVVAYAIIRYRLMDIRLAVTRVGIFLTVYGFVLLFPFWIGYHTKSWAATGVMMAILALSGQAIHRLLQKKAEDILLAKQKAYQKLLLDSVKGMMKIRDFKELMDLIADVVFKAVKPRFAAVYLIDKDKKNYESKSDDRVFGIAHSLAVGHPLIALLNEKQAALDYAQIQNCAPELDAHLVLPLLSDEGLFGFIALGEKEDKTVYDEEDTSTFTLFAYQASLAIENTIYLKRAQDDEIQIQTLSRQARMAHLSGGVGHTINNIFNKIATGLGNFLTEIEADPTPPTQDIVNERYQMFLGIARDAVQKAKSGSTKSRIVMNSARLSIKSESIHPEKFMISGVDFDRMEWGPGLKITEDFDPNPKPIWFSPAFMEDCATNVSNNATDAIHEKVDKIRTGELKIPDYVPELILRTRHDDKFAYLEFIDNGIGIPEEKMKRIGEAYYSSKFNSGKGTGLGVYTVKQQIMAAGGRVEIESVYLKTTTVRIVLPLTTKEQQEEDDKRKREEKA